MRLNIIKSIYHIIISLIFWGVCNAQTYFISGIVTDTSNSPLVGVNIVISGTQYGVSTDANGGYKISNLEPGNYKIEFGKIEKKGNFR